MTWAFSVASRRALGAVSREVLASSDRLGWTSVLVDHHVVRPAAQDFRVPPTPDHTVVAVLGGAQDLGVRSGGGWRWSTYSAGVVGLTGADQGQRLQRRARIGCPLVEKVNIYLPARAVAEVAEHYRRAGCAPRAGLGRGGAHRDAAVVEVARGLSAAVARGAPELYGEAAATWLLTHLLSSPTGDPAELRAGRRPGALARRRAAAVAELIRSRYAEPLTLDRLAAEAHVSKFHLVRQFREATGTTPHAYLLAVRLEAARHLLTSTELTVGQVALRCGFATPSHLAAAYAARFGAAPTRDRVVEGLPDLRE